MLSVASFSSFAVYSYYYFYRIAGGANENLSICIRQRHGGVPAGGEEHHRRAARQCGGADFRHYGQLHADGTTILLVEQNAQAALAVADRGYVLETGRIVTEGAGAELLESDAIRKAYLGG